METLLGRFLTITDRTRLLLVSPPPMVPGTWITETRLLRESARFAGCYENVAKKLGVAFVDAGQWGIDLAFDGVHFLPRGHRTFADRLLTVLEKQ